MVLKIQENYPLKKLTTMQVGGPARFFVEVGSEEELREALAYGDQNKLELFILSGGSNVVISDSGFDGLVVKIEFSGFEVIQEDDEHVWLRVGAGEEWDSVAARAVSKGWWGVENMSWIPGKTGGLAVQNGGAYGQEICETVESVRVYNIAKGEIEEMTKGECNFRYRQSIFNSERAGEYVIVGVVLKLFKRGRPQAGYPDVRKYFDERKINQPSLAEMREAIIYIRSHRLPETGKVGNAGSFFKNLILDQAEFEKLTDNLRENFDEAYVKQARELRNKFKLAAGIKIPTAWLIDICGLKGLTVGHVKVYEKQPLVLISEPGKARAQEVLELFRQVRREAYRMTGMEIVPEPRLVGFSQAELDKYFKLD